MTTRRDSDRLIRAYLDEGRTELSTDAYDAVRSDIERTRQRVVIGPWREPAMPTVARFGVAVAALLIVGIVGFNLTRPNGIGPVGASPVPSANPTPTPSATPTPIAYDWPAPLPAGTYTTSLVWDVPFMTTFTAPSGWEARDIEILKGDTVGVQFTLVDNVYKDPCARTPVDPPIGPKVSDLVEALKSVDGATITHGEPASFGGGPVGRYVELDLPATPACSLEDLSLWHELVEKTLPGKPYGGPDEKAVKPHHRLWILDVGGQRYVIDASHSDDATQADLDEQQAILESILISQPAPTADCSVNLVDDATGAELSGPPYTATLGATADSMRGPVPSPLPSFLRPFARVDFTVDGADWGKTRYATSRPGTNVTPPAGNETEGWSTNQTVNGFQGSMIFDAAGRWLAEFDGVNPACPHTFLIRAAPAG